MIKVTKANIPLLEKFLKKEVFTIQKDVPMLLRDGQIVGWNDVEVTIRQEKKVITAVAGEYLTREKDKLRVYQAPRYCVNDYIIKGFRTYALSDIPYSSLDTLRENLEERGYYTIVDEFRKILCIR